MEVSVEPEDSMTARPTVIADSTRMVKAAAEEPATDTTAIIIDIRSTEEPVVSITVRSRN